MSVDGTVYHTYIPHFHFFITPVSYAIQGGVDVGLVFVRTMG